MYCVYDIAFLLGLLYFKLTLECMLCLSQAATLGVGVNLRYVGYHGYQYVTNSIQRKYVSFSNLFALSVGKIWCFYLVSLLGYERLNIDTLLKWKQFCVRWDYKGSHFVLNIHF